MKDIKFRYYGKKHIAVKHDGVLVCAVFKTGHKDVNGHDEYTIGWNITQNGIKYDKQFSKAVAIFMAKNTAAKIGSISDTSYIEELSEILKNRYAHARKTVKVGHGIYTTYKKTTDNYTPEDFNNKGRHLIVYAPQNLSGAGIDELISNSIKNYFTNVVKYPTAYKIVSNIQSDDCCHKCSCASEVN